MKPKDRVLDRLVPPDWRHYELHPLRRTLAATLAPSPMVWGVNWYAAFDSPDRASDGRWWVARDGNLGQVRGGHAIASPSNDHRDRESWQIFYDQGSEGACVGFSVCRMLTYLNRRRYDGRELYKAAQKVDVWPGESYEGTSVRAGLDVARKRGPCRVRDGVTRAPAAGEGISEYRWTADADDAIRVLGWDHGTKVGAVPWTNSWGDDYPRVVWVPGEVAQRLIDEDGEVAVPVDRTP